MVGVLGYLDVGVLPSCWGECDILVLITGLVAEREADDDWIGLIWKVNVAGVLLIHRLGSQSKFNASLPLASAPLPPLRRTTTSFTNNSSLKPLLLSLSSSSSPASFPELVPVESDRETEKEKMKLSVKSMQVLEKQWDEAPQKGREELNRKMSKLIRDLIIVRLSLSFSFSILFGGRRRKGS